jgi:hypothetical protein
MWLQSDNSAYTSNAVTLLLGSCVSKIVLVEKTNTVFVLFWGFYALVIESLNLLSGKIWNIGAILCSADSSLPLWKLSAMPCIWVHVDTEII